MNTTIFTALINVLNNLDDTQGAQLLSIASGMTNLNQPALSMPVSSEKSELHLEEPSEKREKLNIEGEKMYNGDFCVVTKVDKQYRLYITCPVGGDKGEKIRYAIKANAKKEYGATWAGEYGTGNIFWAFPTKKNAEAFIKERKEYDAKKEA